MQQLDDLELNIVEFANEVISAAVELKRQIADRHLTDEDETPRVVDESNLFLNYQTYTGQKIGSYQVAEKKGNVEERFTRAFNILKADNATISHRYSGSNYKHEYWIYGEKIYRQKR